MTPEEASLWAEELGLPAPPAVPGAVASADPANMGALLTAALEAHGLRTGESERQVAIRAGLTPPALYRALKSPDVRPPTVRAICKALGLRVALVPDR